MARYTGPNYKRARRVGFSIEETGKEIARRPYGPGQHGQDRRGKLSEKRIQQLDSIEIEWEYKEEKEEREGRRK